MTAVGRTFRDSASTSLEFVSADRSSMRAAVRVGRELPVEECDVLPLTTGVFAGKVRKETSEGIEGDMAISFLSRLAIIREVARKIGSARPDRSSQARVFVMGLPGWGELGTVSDLNSERDTRS
ncbi:hypothetical protein [Streptomyces cadmiisoli]|uniref:hypothetical protein n=1 Tax=Streptomyces cadmiisoli TaxID=2184053 RepID=UPI0018EF9FA5|nr:hypothetical protein [Streptomyces cadmiisoli]